MRTGGEAHVPVLRDAVLRYLAPRKGGLYVDATVGPGGHAEAILEAISPEGRLIGVDRDPQALAFARRRLDRFGARAIFVHGDARRLPALLRELGISRVRGVLADLGVSSLQLDTVERGFSFRHDAPLDMRFDTSRGVTAAELLATLGEAELREILWRYGEERQAASIARAIVQQRARQPIRTTRELAALCERVAARHPWRIHPATRTFQALRIAVNRELDDLDALVEGAASVLEPEGRLVVIAFHSLEDRIVKHALRRLARGCVCPPELPACACGRQPAVRLLTRRAVRPAPEECAINPRARSARLRAAERIRTGTPEEVP